MMQLNKIIRKHASEFVTKKEENPTELSNYEVQEMLVNYTFELLSADIDFSIHMNYRDWTTECLWYLGDKAQRDYHNNGWTTYRFGKDLEILGQIPPKPGKYLVCRKDGKIHFENYNGTSFAYNDKEITDWKEILKPKN